MDLGREPDPFGLGLLGAQGAFPGELLGEPGSFVCGGVGVPLVFAAPSFRLEVALLGDPLGLGGRRPQRDTYGARGASRVYGRGDGHAQQYRGDGAAAAHERLCRLGYGRDGPYDGKGGQGSGQQG